MELGLLDGDDALRCMDAGVDTGRSWLTPYPTSDSGTGAPERVSTRCQSLSVPRSGRR